jgi:hypothetical protein
MMIFVDKDIRKVASARKIKNLKCEQHQNTHNMTSSLCLSIDDEILGGSR